MNIDDDYDNDGNNIVPCPICLDVYCPSKEDGKCPQEDEFVKHYLNTPRDCYGREIDTMIHNPPPATNTPDTEWETVDRYSVETGLLKRFFKLYEEGRKTGDPQNFIDYFKAEHYLLIEVGKAISSRDTYLKERVREEKLGWEGYVVVDPQSNNYKCSPIFSSVKEAEKWRRDFGESALKVATVDVILKN